MEMGLRVVPLDGPTGIREVFPSEAHVGNFAHHIGYLNRDSGWANAGQGVSILMTKITALNGKIIKGKNAAELMQQGQKTTGVRCSDGTEFEADLVVLATGSWTGSAFPDVPIGKVFQATGYLCFRHVCTLNVDGCGHRQCIAMVQLTEEEGDKYRQSPVVLDFESGFYIFPVHTLYSGIQTTTYLSDQSAQRTKLGEDGCSRRYVDHKPGVVDLTYMQLVILTAWE